MTALVQALESGDISKKEFETIRLKSSQQSSKIKDSDSIIRMCPIVPSHSADEALTQILISSTEILVLASSAFDVGVPSKFMFQTTLQMKFDLEHNVESDRELSVRLHKTDLEVRNAISKSMGSSESRSLRLGSNVDKEVEKLRDLTYSVTPLLDAAKELKSRINQRRQRLGDDDDENDRKIKRRSIDTVERRNRELREEIESLKQERDAALSLLLRAGEQQAELLRVQKDSRRKSDLKHSRQIRNLRDDLNEKELACEALRHEVNRLRSLL